MEDLGATVVEVDLPEALTSPWGYIAPAWDNEFKPQIEAYLSTLPGDFPQSLQELIEASRDPEIADSSTPVNPARLESFETAVAAPGLADIELLYTLSYQLPRARQTILDIMVDSNLDALIYPTMACPASPLYTVESDPDYICEVDDPYSAGYLANITGFPDMTVPMGFTDAGLPVGLSWMAEAYSESKLLGLAYAYEQVDPVRQPPESTPALAGEEIEYE